MESNLPTWPEGKAPGTLDEFHQCMQASRVLQAEESLRLIASLSETKRPETPKALATELIKAGLLTRFQAQGLLQGKIKYLAFGEYVILEKLGQGGMGQVLKAEHRRMKRIVALKVISGAAMKSADAIRRFQREVHAAARLIHPNIVTAFDANEHAGIHFFVMEYVEGRDLHALIRDQGPLPVATALDCVLQAARGLAYAHGKGIVHRDIKPGNLLLDAEGTVKILDMGLARIDQGVAEGQELTGTGQVMGTVDYMAPEQAEDTHAADGRADIYSLGCTLYRLLTGNVLYGGDTVMKKLLAHRSAPIPALSIARPDVPAAVEAIFKKMVAKRPEDRQQSMAQVVTELEIYLRGSASSPPSGGTIEPTVDLKLSEFLAGISSRGGKSSALALEKSAKKAVSETEVTQDFSLGDTSPSGLASLPPASAAPAVKKPKPRTSWITKHPMLVLLATLCFSVALAAAGIVVFLPAGDGTIRIEINDPSIEVTVSSSGYRIKGRSEEIHLQPGEHTLHVKTGELEFDTTKFALGKGENPPLKVELLPGKVQVVRADGAVLGQRARSTQTGVAEKSKAAGALGSAPAAWTPRSIAQWVFERGGKVVLMDDREISQLNDLPSGDFGLKRVDLGGIKSIGDAEAKLIAQWPDIRGIMVPGTSITNTGLRELAALDLGGVIFISGSSITGEGFDAFNGKKLGMIMIGDQSKGLPAARFTREGWQRLADVGSTFSWHIGGLIVDETDEAVRQIVSRHPEITTFIAPGSSLTDAGLESLASLPRLRSVSFALTPQMTDAGLLKFRATKTLENLQVWRDGQAGKVTPAGYAALHEALPACRIVWGDTTIEPTAGAKAASGPGFALEFNGKDSYVDLPTLRYDGAHPITLEATIVPVGAGEFGTIIGTNSGRASLGVCGLNVAMAGRARFQIGESQGGYRRIYSLSPLTLGQRVHIAGVFDGTVFRIFVDGKKQAQASLQVGIETTNNTFSIGGIRSEEMLQSGLSAVIDELRVSKAARYSTDFRPLERLDSDTDTIALYHFDEGQGNVLTDSSGNSHHGKIVNAKWVSGLGAGPPLSPDRRAAQAVLAFGGTATIRIASQERAIKPGEVLPNEDFELVRLQVMHQPTLNDAAVRPLLDAPHLIDIQLLDVPLTDVCLESIARLAKLEILLLTETGVTGSGLPFLQANKQLKKLGLDGGPINDQGLANITGLQSLDLLWLGGTPITDAGLLYVKQLKQIQFLNLGETRVSDAGTAMLRGLSDLRTLILTGTDITDASMDHLRAFPKLEELQLSNTALSDAGLTTLAAKGPKSLARLHLNGTRISDAGVVQLKAFPRLRVLYLDGTAVTDSGLEQLKGLKKLSELTLNRTKTTSAGVEALRMALPECQIIFTVPGKRKGAKTSEPPAKSSSTDRRPTSDGESKGHRFRV